CRALTDSDAPPDRPASAVLTEFLGLAVDALVRAALPDTLPGYSESVHDEWLHALRSSVAAVQDAGSPKLLEQVRTWQRPVAVSPREYVLGALGQAAGLSPDIEASLKQATPSGYATDAGGAHRFLTETSWALEQMGFGVLLPAWWTRKGTKQKLTAGATVK